MKTEEGTGSEPAKPRFRPKAQARKKPPPPPPPVTDYRGAAANYRAGRTAGTERGSFGGGERRYGGRGGYDGRGGRHWQDSRSGGGRGGRDGRGGRGRHGGGRAGGRGRGGFVPVGQDFFVGGGGSGPTAYMPAGVSAEDRGDVTGEVRGGGDTSESEDERDRKRLSKVSKPKKEGLEKVGEGKPPVSGSSSRIRATGAVEGKEDLDDDEDIFGVGAPVSKAGEGEGMEDVDSLMGGSGADIGRRPRSSKLPGMRVTGNVMSEEDSMRPVALPVTATAQTPGARLFAQANNQANLMEEEDSSLFFVQLPTKLPRPLPAFQRGKDDDSSSAGGLKAQGKGGKGKGKASVGGSHVKEETGGSAERDGADGMGGGKGKGATIADKAAEIAMDNPAFDQGLRRMRAGKIGKLYVHQSGKARLVIGGVSFVVHPGLPVSFVEQGVSIDAGKKTFCSFGQVTKRAVCTPDFEQLYRRADEMSGGGGGGSSVDGLGEGATGMDVG